MTKGAEVALKKGAEVALKKVAPMPDIFGHDEMSVQKNQKCLSAHAGAGGKVQESQMKEYNQWIEPVQF